jgi:hypothetical protein
MLESLRAPLSRTSTGTALATSRGELRGVQLNAGSDAATVIVKDGGASGTVLASLKALANTTQVLWFPGVLPFTTDLHVTLTGTSPEVFLFL